MKKKLLYPIKAFLEVYKIENSINKEINSIVKEIENILTQKSKDKKLLDERLILLTEKIKLLIAYIFSIEGLTPKIEHDLRNKVNILLSLDLIRLLPITNRANKVGSNLNDSFINFLYFLESLYIYSLNKKETNEFIKENAINYKLFDLINLIIKYYKDKKIKISIKNFDKDIIINGLKGDFYIFIENIIKNSIFRGKAKNIKIYTKQDGENSYLYIADDGTGIDNNIFNNPNDILQLGKSGNGSTGMGLSNLEKRQIKCKVSNDGLKSHFKDLEEVKTQNPSFRGRFNKKGTLIKIKLKTQKAE